MSSSNPCRRRGGRWPLAEVVGVGALENLGITRGMRVERVEAFSIKGEKPVSGAGVEGSNFGQKRDRTIFARHAGKRAKSMSLNGLESIASGVGGGSGRIALSPPKYSVYSVYTHTRARVRGVSCHEVSLQVPLLPPDLTFFFQVVKEKSIERTECKEAAKQDQSIPGERTGCRATPAINPRRGYGNEYGRWRCQRTRGGCGDIGTDRNGSGGAQGAGWPGVNLLGPSGGLACSEGALLRARATARPFRQDRMFHWQTRVKS